MRQKLQCSKARYEHLAKCLALEAKIDPRPVLSGDKGRQFRSIRWTAWKILHDAGCSAAQIGKASGFDHTTVIYALTPEWRHLRRARYRAWAKSAGRCKVRGEYRVRPVEAA